MCLGVRSKPAAFKGCSLRSKGAGSRRLVEPCSVGCLRLSKSCETGRPSRRPQEGSECHILPGVYTRERPGTIVDARECRDNLNVEEGTSGRCSRGLDVIEGWQRVLGRKGVKGKQKGSLIRFKPHTLRSIQQELSPQREQGQPGRAT